MDSYCATLGGSTHLTRTGKRDGESGFWGERISGSLKSNVLVNKLSMSLKIDQRIRKIKPGVAFSVMTSNNATEIIVSSIGLQIFFCLFVYLVCSFGWTENIFHERSFVLKIFRVENANEYFIRFMLLIIFLNFRIIGNFWRRKR